MQLKLLLFGTATQLFLLHPKIRVIIIKLNAVLNIFNSLINKHKSLILIVFSNQII